MSFHLSALDNDELVHTAVREGHVISLEIYLNQNPNCINKLYIFNQAKWTPLIAACYYKHEHIVRMLLTRFKPDVNAVGTVNIRTLEDDFELVEEVSSLWIAAAVNNFNIVKLLIEHGNADINQLTKTHSTPIRVACYWNNLEMVKYLMEHGADPHRKRQGNYTNLMLSVYHQYSSIVKYLVIETKCDINEQDEDGQTALYGAVRSGSVEITKFLLEHGALNICDNKRKVTPLLRAALFGDATLVDTFKGYCSDLQWIEAKELLSTYFSGCLYGHEDLNKTYEYLNEAFELRLAKNLPKKIDREPLESLFNHFECENLEELNELISSNRKDALCIEAILIHRRLLGDDHFDYHGIVHYYGNSLAHTQQYHECFRWWFYEFDLKQKYHITLEDRYLRGINDIFTRMTFREQVQIPIDDFRRIFEIIDHILMSDVYHESFNFNLIVLLHLITIVAGIIYDGNVEDNEHLSIDHRRQFYKAVTHVVRRQYKTITNESSLLHLCVDFWTEKVSSDLKYPCCTTTRLLLEAGANVNAADIDGNTPLHVVTSQLSLSNMPHMIDILCASGAHLDYVDNNKHTPVELISSYDPAMIEYLKKKMGVSRLKCICARTIRQEEFSIDDILAVSLVTFVQKH